MFSLYAALFLAIAFTAKGELHDGPCPKPATTFDWEAIKDRYLTKATWYVLSSNYNKAKNPATARKCFQFVGEEVDDNHYGTMTFTDSNGHHTLEMKFETSSPTTFDTYIKNADGEWVSYEWRYTPVSIEDKYALEHVCKEEGDKHEDFFAIFGLDKNIPEDLADKFRKHVKDFGDEREFVLYDHENC